MKIAIKGLIGSGKTTTSTYLCNNYNAYHFNCDAEVKKLYATNIELIAKVNSQILGDDGDSIDIGKLREVAFGNKDKLLKLESIVYPYLAVEIDKAANSTELLLLDCQQIDKMNIDLDYTFIVTLSDQKIHDRVAKRDGRTSSQIDEILAIQKQYVNSGNYYEINNDAGLEQLYMQIDKVMEEIKNENNR